MASQLHGCLSEPHLPMQKSTVASLGAKGTFLPSSTVSGNVMPEGASRLDLPYTRLAFIQLLLGTYMAWLQPRLQS